MNKDKKVLVAVYGSLRLGMGNYLTNENANGVYKFTGTTKEDYNLYRYGSCYFPSVSLKHNDNGAKVVVDVFEAPLRGLEGSYDSLEGHCKESPESGFYDRSEVTVVDDDGKEYTAWIYHIDEEQDETVPSGDWAWHVNSNYYDDLAKAEG